jgi:hypothetical protein
MDSSGFQLLARNFTNLTQQECDQLKDLARQHPYSQLIHLMRSRAAQDLKQPDQNDLLHQSAVYSSDRSVLKWVMTTSRKDRTADVPAPIAKKTAPSQPVADKARVSAAVVPEKLAIKAEITGLNAALIDAKPEAKAGKPEAQTNQPVQKVENVKPVKSGVIAGAKPVKDVKTQIPEVKPEKAEVSAKAVAIENGLSGDALREDLYRELEKLQKLKHDFEESIDEFQRTHPIINAELGVPKVVTEPLLEEIKTTRKKIKIDSPRQKEQNEIIDQFIKTQPSLPKAKAVQPANDLSEDSGIFGDNIVSETLVDILLKQGKKDKAIEVLKKLIWKFPQKKAYFAAQIEDLKN